MDGLVQDCGNSIAEAMELPQPCTKPSIDMKCKVTKIYISFVSDDIHIYSETCPWEINGHSELTVVTAPGPNAHGSVTARRGHSSITAQSRLAVTILVTMSPRWAHRELTVSSHGGQFFSHGWWCVSYTYIFWNLMMRIFKGFIMLLM